MNDNIKFMIEAFKLAFNRIGLTSPNPPVGAIIVKDNKIISTGNTQEYGHDHAEVVAIKNATKSVKGADIFVTLEPCCHTGKTPPCTDIIIKNEIKRVFIPILDPNPLVSGKGVKKLEDAGIEVIILEELKDWAYHLLAPFFTYILDKRPHIIHKAALTLDGKIATGQKDSKWISSPLSRLITHRFRSLVDGIIIGKGTFDNDKPLLNVRVDDFESESEYLKLNQITNVDKNYLLKLLSEAEFKCNNNTPYKIVIGLPSKIDITSKFFENSKYYIFANDIDNKNLKERDDYKNIKELVDKKKIIFIEAVNKDEFLQKILHFLYTEGLMFLMLEGGCKLAASFLDNKFIDQVMYFITPKILGGGFSVYEGKGFNLIKDCINVNNVTNIFLKNDLLYHGYLEYK